MRMHIPIRIEKLNTDTEEWEVYLPLLHANINKSRAGNEYLNAGAVQSKTEKVFEVRYSHPVKAIEGSTQDYRIVYDDQSYDIIDYDDFQERHKFVKLLGVR
jgi:SPP1 family predicted phage head-tail adaptor